MSINDQRIAFIGCGNMAQSIIGGLIQGGHASDNIIAAAPSLSHLEQAKSRFTIQTTSDNHEAVSSADIIVLAVKPQILKSVLQDLAPSISTEQLLLSIAACISDAALRQWTGQNQAIVRVMPNTPSLIGSGVSILYANAHVNDSQCEMAESLLRSVGITCWVEQEALLDAMAPISGSGPAYCFRIMEIMQQIAQGYGMQPAQAKLCGIQTLLGSARLALESDQEFAQLRRNVTSAGGVTESALAVFEKARLDKLFAEAIEAGRQRSEEIERENH